MDICKKNFQKTKRVKVRSAKLFFLFLIFFLKRG